MGERTSSPPRGPMSSGRRPKAPPVRLERAACSKLRLAERGPSSGSEASHIQAAGKAKRGWSLTSAAQKLGGAGQLRRRPSARSIFVGCATAPASRLTRELGPDPLTHRWTVDGGCFAQRGGPRLPKRVTHAPTHSLSGCAFGNPEGRALPSSPAQGVNVTSLCRLPLRPALVLVGRVQRKRGRGACASGHTHLYHGL